MKFLFSIILSTILVHAARSLASNQTNETCEVWSNKHIKNARDFSHFYNMTFTFVQIDALDDLNEASTCPSFEYNFDYIKIFSRRRILLDNDRNFSGVLSLFNRTHTPTDILLENVKGFNQKLKIFSEKSRYNTPHSRSVQIYDVNFDFYVNGSLLEAKDCNVKNVDSKSKMVNFFGDIQILMLTEKVFFNNKVCPYVFVNSNIQQLHLNQITNSLIFRNRLAFVKLGESTKLNDWKTSNLAIFVLNVYFEKISTLNVDMYACKNLQYLLIKGNIDGIEEDLFTHFRELKFISLTSEVFVNFFHSGTTWMNSLNADLNVNLDSEHAFRKSVHRLISLEINLFRFLTFNAYYDFPNEDICLFREFPHQKLVLPIITFGKSLPTDIKCSCSLIWLLKYTERYLKDDFKNYTYANIEPDYKETFDNITVRICFREMNFTRQYDACNFTRRFTNCQLKKFKMLQNVGIVSLVFLVKWFQLIIDVYLRTILGFVGILTNYLTIRVLCNRKHAKNFKSIMYKHNLVNAIFNILFLSTQLLALMNSCIYPKSSFCSILFRNEIVQYINIYFVLFLGNSFRLTCTFSYISFSVSRFALSALRDNNKFRAFMVTINLKRYYTIFFAASLLLSSFFIFEYRVNSDFAKYDPDFINNAYDVKYCENLGIRGAYIRKFTPEHNFYLKCSLFKSLNLINNMIKNVVFIILSLVVDVLMIRYLSKVIEKKRALNSPHLEEAIKLKTKLNKIIITNGIVFFLSNMPEFIVTLSFIFNKSDVFSNFCIAAFNCTDIIETTQSFHFISMGFQFFIFLKYDKNFLNSFANIFSFNK